MYLKLAIYILLDLSTFIFGDEVYTCKFVTKKQYFLDKDIQLNWHAANRHCKRQQKQLATIKDRKEYEAMLEYIRPLYPGKIIGGIWIGGNELAEPGVWRWISTEEDIKFFNWNSGEPNKLQNNEHCIDQFGYDLLWNDNSCDSIRLFVCESVVKEQVCSKLDIPSDSISKKR